jgi:hypothetical protein
MYRFSVHIYMFCVLMYSFSVQTYMFIVQMCTFSVHICRFRIQTYVFSVQVNGSVFICGDSVEAISNKPGKEATSKNSIKE